MPTTLSAISARNMRVNACGYGHWIGPKSIVDRGDTVVLRAVFGNDPDVVAKRLASDRLRLVERGRSRGGLFERTPNVHIASGNIVTASAPCFRSKAPRARYETEPARKGSWQCTGANRSCPLDGAAEVDHLSRTGRARLHQVATSAMAASLCSGQVGGKFVVLFAQNRTTKRVLQLLRSSLLGRLAITRLVVLVDVSEVFAIIVAIRSDGS